MKKEFYSIIVFCLTCYTATAQWNINSAGDAYNTNSSGKVGIGIGDPTDQLHLSGNIRMSGPSRKIVVGSEGSISDYLMLQDVGIGNLAFQWVQDGQTKFSIEGVTGNIDLCGNIRLSGSARKIIVGSEGSTSDYLLLQDVGSGSPAFQWVQDGIAKVSIDGVTGNVGIGIEPSEKLTVDGKIRGEEVKVEIVNGPDYVFEPDYNLRTLPETKEYILKNKHLPEIPSANEMEANGVDLGDMNMRLLKKIEELTLYQIELLEKLEQQNKQIEKLKTSNARIDELEKKFMELADTKN